MTEPFRCEDHDRDFVSLNALANHLQNSGDHAVSEWPAAMEAAEKMSATPDGGDDHGDGEQDAAGVEDADADAGDGDPVVGDRTPPQCPECGGSRWFDASAHTDYEYGCADCSDEQTWVVWSE